MKGLEMICLEMSEGGHIYANPQTVLRVWEKNSKYFVLLFGEQLTNKAQEVVEVTRLTQFTFFALSDCFLNRFKHDGLLLATANIYEISHRVMKERFLEYLRYLGIGQNAFENKVGLSGSTINNIKNGIRSDKLALVAEKCPDLNIEWLLTGEGEMLKTEKEVATYSNIGKPYYAVDFIAGFDLVYNDQSKTPDGQITFDQFKSADCWVDISGKSMEPLISSGDIIALKKVEDWTVNILYGEVYAIVTSQYRTVKRIRKAEKEGNIKLVPENPEYDSQEIPVTNVIAVFQVLGAAKKIF